VKYIYSAEKIGMKRVKGPLDTDREHYAVLIYRTESFHVPGDERSRTHPGHGYPAHTKTTENTEHWITMDKEVLKKFLLLLQEEQQPPPHNVLQVWPMKVRTTVKLEVEV